MSIAGDIINGLIKKAIYDFAMKRVIAKVIAKASFLAWPVINPVFVFAMNHLAGMLFEEMKTRVDFKLIDFETNEDREQYEEAMAELRSLPEPTNEEETRNARDEVNRRMGDLIRFPAR